MNRELKNCPCCDFPAKIKGGGTSRKYGKMDGSVYCPRCGIETKTGDLDVQMAIWDSRIVLKTKDMGI